MTAVICAYCEEPFQVPAGHRGRPPKYCERHRTPAHRKATSRGVQTVGVGRDWANAYYQFGGKRDKVSESGYSSPRFWELERERRFRRGEQTEYTGRVGHWGSGSGRFYYTQLERSAAGHRDDLKHACRCEIRCHSRKLDPARTAIGPDGLGRCWKCGRWLDIEDSTGVQPAWRPSARLPRGTIADWEEAHSQVAWLSMAPERAYKRRDRGAGRSNQMAEEWDALELVPVLRADPQVEEVWAEAA